MLPRCLRTHAVISRSPWRDVFGVWLLAAGIVLAWASRIEAATYYVRSDGNDANSGTGSDAANAWATVVGAATKSLAAGDIVYVRAGTYVGEVSPSVDGTAANPIQFIADADGAVFGTPGNIVLQATSGVHVLNIQTDDYLYFVGFQLRGDNVSSDTVEINALGFVLERCEIYNGGGAGVDVNGGSVTLINCLIRNNISDGISLDSGNLTVWNSTIAANNSDGIEQHAGTSTITNSIIANNSSDGLDFNGGSMTHTYNLVYGNVSDNWEGTSASTGELSAAPQFVGGNDYRLLSSSPAIDAGTSATGTVDEDLLETARPINGLWDIGCYEGGLTAYYVRTDGSDANTGTGPGVSDAWATVHFAANQLLSPGDIVYVRAGTYTGEVKPDIDGAAGNPIEFRADTTGSVPGWNPGDVLLQAEGGKLQALDIKDDDYLYFDGFRMQSGSDVVVKYDNSIGGQFHNCEMFNGDKKGLEIKGNSSTLLLINCLIYGNDDEGIKVSDGSLTVWNTTIVYNGKEGIRSNGSTTVTNSIICYNEVGLRLDGDTFTHTYNLVYGNIAADYESLSASTGELALDPLFISTSDYRLQATSPAVNAGTNAAGTVDDDLQGKARPVDSLWDMGCYEGGTTVYYVRTDGSNLNSGLDSDSATAWATVAHAATASLLPGDVVYVRAGTYAGSVAASVDGTLSNPIKFIADTTGSTAGWSAGPVVLQASASGKALDIDNDDYLEFYHFTLAGDSGNDAVDIDVGQGVVISHCEIYGGNTGIEVDEGASVSIVNCLIHDNNYKGINVLNGTADIWNCTIASNVSDGFELELGTTTVTNCIIAGNGDDGLDHNGGTLTHTYNLVHGNIGSNYEGTTASTGEISVDPQFANTTNFRLKESSPALDAGTNAAGTVDDDLRAVARPLQTSWDMGCYEGSCLYGHWKLVETSGTKAVDSSGSGLDGTYTAGVTLAAAGPYAGEGAVAATFTTAGDRVDLPATSNEFSDGVTIALWYKVTSLSGTHTDFLSLSNGALVDDIWVGLDHTQGLEIFLADPVDGASSRNLQENATPVTDRWQHGVVVIDPAGNATLYRNGVVVRSGFVGIPTNVARTQNRIAESVFGHGNNGSLFDVRLYCYPLSALEVSELYGLVGHWKMDEGIGTTATDSSGLANDAAINGATWTSDCAGKVGLEFDGIDDTATTGSPFEPPATGAVAFWMRGSGPLATRQRPFGVNADWEGRVESTGTMSFDLGASPYVGNEPFATTTAVDGEDRWYHIIANFNATDDTYEVYVNGALEASGVSPVNLLEQVDGILSFGTRTGSAEFWKGALRDFRVFNRWLTDAEMSELSGLVGYWKLDETSGTVASDASPNGYDGTLSGNPTWITAGNVDGALDFETSDGDDRVDVGSFNVSGNELSIAAWVRPEDGGTDRRIIIKASGLTLAEQYWGMAIGSSLELDFRLKAGGTTDFFTEANVLSRGKWFHTVGTYDGTTMRMYVNGVEIRSVVHTTGGALDVDATVPVTIGAANVSGRFFDGVLDDVQVFNRVLCAEEVRGLYRGGRPAGIRILKWVEAR